MTRLVVGNGDVRRSALEAIKVWREHIANRASKDASEIMQKHTLLLLHNAGSIYNYMQVRACLTHPDADVRAASNASLSRLPSFALATHSGLEIASPHMRLVSRCLVAHYVKSLLLTADVLACSRVHEQSHDQTVQTYRCC